MPKYTIIGNMTGNSMDAVDLVLTEFDGENMSDICSYTSPYSKDMQNEVEHLRKLVHNKTAAEIDSFPAFQKIHDEYIEQIAECINSLCAENHIDKKAIDAIGFHGKTLDHNPPSKALKEGTEPYTLQIGSGQMLADLTGIPVIYDFRSDFIMAGFDGAPLVPPHNALIAGLEGDGCYYNGGNTSNFAIVVNEQPLFAADAGPFNEYTDNYIRRHTDHSFDKDGQFGKAGKLNRQMLQKLFDFGRVYYETALPKSGDPAYYHKEEIFNYVESQNISFADAVYTFEYFAAYIAAQALTLVPNNIPLPFDMILFGGGWKNPIVRDTFATLLDNKAFVLPEHEAQFSHMTSRFFRHPTLRFSKFGDYMEARLFADLARYKLEGKPWPIPETDKIVCGVLARPQKPRSKYSDCVSRAAKGWQNKF